MPSWPTGTSKPSATSWPSATGWPAQTSWPTSSTFNGNFASLFSGVLQSVQTDLGVSYGGTMLATGTVPPVITLTGTLSGTPTAITITDTLPGILGTWTGLVTYGDGSTQAFTSGATVALTGRGSGLTLNIAAGAAAGDNVWQATCSGLADQSGNALHYSQGTTAQQPVVSSGLNGIASLVFNGTSSNLVSSLNLPQSGITPTGVLATLRVITFGSAGKILCMSAVVADPCELATVDAATLGVRNPTLVTLAYTYNSWCRVRVDFSNNASDVFRVGAAQTTGNAGNAGAQNGRNIGAFNAGAFPSNVELLALMYLNRTVTSADQVLYDAAVASKYAGGVAV